MVDGGLDGIEKRVEEMIDRVTGAMAAGPSGMDEGLEMSPSVPNLNMGSQEARSIRETIMSAQHNVVSGNDIMPVCAIIISRVWLLNII
jgi:hypothetical protein